MDPSKNNISTYCNSLKEYLVKENTDKKHNGIKIKQESKRTNWMFILLNIFYLITALLVLAAGATGLMYSSYGPKFELNLVSVLWIISGVALLFVSFFGIIGACKNSVACINIYGILMSVAFLLQLSASITTYTLIRKSESIAKDTLDNFIYEIESFQPSSGEMDFIQKSFQCCGVQTPNDWGKYWKYDDFSNHSAPTQRTPQSCCTSGSDYTNGICDSYYQNGCIVKMTELTLQIMLTVYFTGLIIAVVQIIGIVSAFVFANMIATTKSYEGIYTLHI